MAATITVKCTSRKEEKSWQTDDKGKALNRVTFEFSPQWISDPDDADYKNNRKFDGTTINLSTTDKKVADTFKVDQEYTLSIKR